MNTTEQILLIVLASFLAIFLMVSIILLVGLVKLTKKMQLVADKAHEIVNNVENVSDMFKKTAGPLAFGKFFMNIAQTVAKHKKEK
jgi:hypothetical protein